MTESNSDLVPHGRLGGWYKLAGRYQESSAGYLFILPALLVLTVFVLIPIGASLILAFTDYPLLAPPVWNGVENLRRLFNDARLRTCYRNSLVITICTVTLNNLLGLLLGFAVNRQMPRVLTHLFRSALFFPVLTTTSSLALVWQFILTRDRGIMNWLLRQIGLGPVPWLAGSQWAIWSVIMYDVWKSSGYFMVLYIAGLQGIPEVLYEAAKVDGANRWQLIRHITLPLITPTVFFCIVIACIGAFQIFDIPYVLTEGGPGDASRTIAMYVYEVAFQRFEMGYASVVSVSLLVILVTLTLAQLAVGRKWVHYE